MMSLQALLSYHTFDLFCIYVYIEPFLLSFLLYLCPPLDHSLLFPPPPKSLHDESTVVQTTKIRSAAGNPTNSSDAPGKTISSPCFIPGSICTSTFTVSDTTVTPSRRTQPNPRQSLHGPLYCCIIGPIRRTELICPVVSQVRHAW